MLGRYKFRHLFNKLYLDFSLVSQSGSRVSINIRLICEVYWSNAATMLLSFSFITDRPLHSLVLGRTTQPVITCRLLPPGLTHGWWPQAFCLSGLSFTLPLIKIFTIPRLRWLRFIQRRGADLSGTPYFRRTVSRWVHLYHAGFVIALNTFFQNSFSLVSRPPSTSTSFWMFAKFPGYQAAAGASAGSCLGKKLTAARVAKTPTTSTGMEKLGPDRITPKTHPVGSVVGRATSMSLCRTPRLLAHWLPFACLGFSRRVLVPVTT